MKHWKMLLGILLLSLSGCMTQPKSNDSKASPEELPPELQSPSVKKIWIPALLKNNGLEWESGHYLYRIERGVQWTH